MQAKRLTTFVSFLALTFAPRWRSAMAASGTMNLYLNNNTLDSDPERSSGNIAYYGEYYIGEPPRRFLGCLDTGSSDTWVPSNTCTSQVCLSHDQYDPAQSSSDRNTSQRPVIIRYGTGSVGALLTFETVSLAGVNITNQGIGLATGLTTDFSDTSCDGLVGLAFEPLSTINAQPIFVNAALENVLNQSLFSIWLSPYPGVEPAGQLTLGTTDPSRYSGSIQYIDLSRQAYWQLPMSGITVGSSSAGVVAQSAIVDSGTTAIVMSTGDAERVNSLIPNSAYWDDADAWNVSCNVNQLPDVTFTLGGQAFSVPARLYVQQLTDSRGRAVNICVSAIVSGTGRSQTSFIILGTNFLRAWYSVYKFDPNTLSAQVGLARAVGQAGTATGGRRLSQETGQPLFRAAAHTLHRHKWRGPEARRRLAEMEAAVFARSAESVRERRWGRGAVNISVAEGRV